MAYHGGPMTEAMYYVLLALMHPNHGYQLMQAIEEVSNGRVKMGAGNTLRSSFANAKRRLDFISER